MKKSNYLIKLCVAALLASAMFLVSGCYSTNGQQGYNRTYPTAYNSAYVVRMADIHYYPKKIVVNPGQRVTWVNQDRVTHTVTSNRGYELDSVNIAPGQAYTHVFSHRGVYYYHCRFHPGMVGVVIVR